MNSPGWSNKSTALRVKAEHSPVGPCSANGGLVLHAGAVECERAAVEAIGVGSLLAQPWQRSSVHRVAALDHEISLQPSSLLGYLWSARKPLCASRGWHRRHRGQEARGSRVSRPQFDWGRSGLCRDESQPCRPLTPFASLPVGRIGGPRFRVVPSPLGKVAGGEGLPVKCFRHLRSAKKRSPRQCTRVVLAYARPTRVERAMLS